MRGGRLCARHIDQLPWRVPACPGVAAPIAYSSSIGQPRVLDRFIEHDCVCPGPFESLRARISGSRYVFPFEAFLRFLTDRGELPDPVPPRGAEPWEAGFRDWLRQHRGLGEKTIHRYVRTVHTFLAGLGKDPERYDAERIRQVLLTRFEKASWTHARSLATAMRMYLRFLAAGGACPPRLVDAVPTAPAWQLARLPRYLRRRLLTG